MSCPIWPRWPLDGLRELDLRHYERWFDLGDSDEDALRREMSLDPRGIAAFTKYDGDELGYSFFAWNGLSDDNALNVHCSFSATSQWLKNRVVFWLPSAWEHDLVNASSAEVPPGPV